MLDFLQNRFLRIDFMNIWNHWSRKNTCCLANSSIFRLLYSLAASCSLPILRISAKLSLIFSTTSCTEKLNIKLQKPQISKQSLIHQRAQKYTWQFFKMYITGIRELVVEFLWTLPHVGTKLLPLILYPQLHLIPEEICYCPGHCHIFDDTLWHTIIFFCIRCTYQTPYI